MGRLWWQPRERWWWVFVIEIVVAVALMAIMWAQSLALVGSLPLIGNTAVEYRLVSPDEAKHLVNDEGWRISSRMRPTDTLVYLYHDKP